MAENPILRRKIEQSRVLVTSYPKLAVLAAAHAREAAAAMRTLFNTLADASTEATAVVRSGRYLRGLPTPAVLGVVEVDGVPNSAAIHLDPELVSHVIDLSLGGDPGADHAYPERTPTATDLAICRRFANVMLAAFERAVATVCGGRSLGALTCARFETAPQMLSIAPDRSEVLIVNQRVELGEGGRNGFFEMVLPLSVIDPVKSDLIQHGGAPSPLNAALWERHLRGSLKAARLPLDAVIDSQRLTLGELTSLSPGDVLKLGRNAVDEVELMVETRQGRRAVARCRLGAKGGLKAVKLLDEPDRELLGEFSGAG